MSKFSLTIIIFFFVQIALKASDLIITPILPTGLEVCQEGLFGIVLENPTTDTTKDISIQIQMPNGLLYVVGTVNGGGAIDTSTIDTNAPIFEIDDFLPSQMDTIWFTAKASCDLVGAINSATIFQNTINATFTGGSKTIISPPFSIETALLVMTPVVPVVANGMLWGDVLTRTITIRNTRPAALSSFYFQDLNNGQLEITTTLGTVETTYPNNYRIELTGADFMTVGDGDTLFELNEIIVITENITIRSCGGVVPSDLQAFWGCDGAVCQMDNFNAAIQVNTSPYKANLEFRPTTNRDDCYCGDNGVPQQMVITNTGDDVAMNPIFEIRAMAALFDTELNAIEDSSITLTYQGQTTSVTPAYWMNTKNDCFADDELKERVALTLPDLEPGDSVIIDWEMYFCLDTCTKAFEGFEYAYSYFDNCPPFTRIEDSVQVFKTLAAIGAPEMTNVPDSGGLTAFDFSYQFLDTFDIINQTNGFFNVKVELPCGFTWDGDASDFVMEGQNPFSAAYDTSTRQIDLKYTLPFAAADPEMDFSLDFDCDASCGVKDGTEKINMTAFLFFDNTCDTANCRGLQICSGDMTVTIDCINAPCEDTLIGLQPLDYSLERVNYGFADNNNDNLPDATGTIDMNLVARKRAMIGDTIIEKAFGVILDEYNQGYEYAWWQSLWKSSIGTNANLLNPDGFSLLTNQVTIFDKSANATYTCPNLEYYSTVVGDGASDSLYYHLNLNTGHLDSLGCVPSSFKWEKNDSIWVENTYKINYNVADMQMVFGHNQAMMQGIPNIRLSTASELPNYHLYICDTLDVMEVSGYRLFMGLGSNAVLPCVDNDFSGLSSIQFYLADPNFFPYEYREFATLQNIGMLVDSNFVRDTTRMTFAGIPEAQILLLERGIPVDSFGMDGTQFFDIEPFRDTIFDEGFYFFIQNVFEGDCRLDGFYPVEFVAQLQLSKELNDSIITKKVINNSSIRPLRPSLDFFTILPNITAASDSICMDFTITNMPNNVGSLQSEEAFNMYLHPISPDGSIGNFTIIDKLTNTPLTNINDIFTYGDLLKNESREFTLCALNYGCGEEELILKYGWNCTPHTHPTDTTCYEQETQFNIQSALPEVEMTITNPATNNFALCTNIPFHVAEVFNADLGIANDLKLELVMPQGLTIVSGTCELSYPDGATFVSIADPVNMNGNIFEWDVSALNATLNANGLRNINEYPDNTFNIRFNVMADCDYIAGSRIVFRARGENICDEPTNAVTRVSNPINISGAVPAYTTSINIIADTVAGCVNALTSQFDLVVSGATGNDDSVFVTLPFGIDYVANSYNALTNATSNAPFVQTENGLTTLKWKLNNVTAGSTISFSIQTENYTNFDCADELLFLVQTVSPANALCVASNTVCDILVATGTQEHRIRINRPSLDITNLQFVVTASGNQDYVRRAMTIQNNGASMNGATPVIIQYYYDLDGNGIATAADSLLHSQTQILNLAAGGTVNLSQNDAGFNTPQGWHCNIIAVIDTAGNCLCSGSQSSATNITQFNIPTINGCSESDITLGQSALTGYQYQWQSNTVACPNCATTTTNIVNNSNAVTYFSFVQIATSPVGCATQYNYSVGISPSLGTLNDSVSTCAGDSISLQAMTGSNYTWTGQHIANATQQTTSALPDSSQWYQVSITDNFNCVYVDSVFATVHQLLAAVAGSDQSICDNEAFTQLAAQFDPNYTYFWTPISTVSNPFNHHPIVFPAQTTTYQLLVTDNNGCQTTDEATVYVVPSPAPTTASTSICFGDTLFYSDTLIWQSGVYDLELQSWNGCDSLHTLTVSVLDTAFTDLEVDICNGETYELGGSFYNQTGRYCHTFTGVNGCDSTVCVDLLVENLISTAEDSTLCFGDTLVWNGQIYTETGDYFQTFTSSLGCDSTHRITLTYFDEMTVGTTADSLEIWIGESADVEVFGGIIYEWLPDQYLSCNDCSTPTITPTSDIEYLVNIEDENGCKKSLTITVKSVNQCIEGIAIPNAISPNGDGINDTFGVITPAGISNFRMRIYNRWGELVFETTNPLERWNAERRNRNQVQDAYVYVIEGDCVAGEEFYLKGSFIIVR